MERRVTPGVVLEAAIAARRSRGCILTSLGFVIEKTAPEIQNGRPVLQLQARCDGEWRALLTLRRFALHAHGSSKRFIELFGCLLAGLHQTFEIGGGTALQGR